MTDCVPGAWSWRVQTYISSWVSFFYLFILAFTKMPSGLTKGIVHLLVEEKLSVWVLAGYGGQTQLALSAKSADLKMSVDDLTAQHFSAALACLLFLFPQTLLHNKTSTTSTSSSFSSSVCNHNTQNMALENKTAWVPLTRHGHAPVHRELIFLLVCYWFCVL